MLSVKDNHLLDERISFMEGSDHLVPPGSIKQYIMPLIENFDLPSIEMDLDQRIALLAEAAEGDGEAAYFLAKIFNNQSGEKERYEFDTSLFHSIDMVVTDLFKGNKDYLL